MTQREYKDMCKMLMEFAVENGLSDMCLFMSNNPDCEKKTQRVQLLMQPNVLKRAKAAANKKHISLNEYIHRAVVIALGKDER